MKKIIKPSHIDSENSVDLFDGDRLNAYGGVYCVAVSIRDIDVEPLWNAYVKLNIVKSNGVV